MTHLEDVEFGRQSLDRYRPIVGEERFNTLTTLQEQMQRHLAGRVVWNVNSTARGGGVAEMLRPLLAYVRGAGVDARWRVIRGTEPFYALTKRLHHALHGAPGDGTSLDESRRTVYDKVSEDNAHELCALVASNDVVILHDPQTVGLIPHVKKTGATVIWRCHIGADTTNDDTTMGWSFLAPYLEDVDATVFSRQAYVPKVVDQETVWIIPPAIDAFAPKNEDMSQETARAILVHAGIIEGPTGQGSRVFTREDGSPGRVDRHADIVRMGRAPEWDTPLVVQVSRWDPLKDHAGVMEGFAALADGAAPENAELVLAGPNVHAVTDDPEGERVFYEVESAWRALPHGTRNLVHLVSLPMLDAEENAAMVNALQRHATIIVQKSLHEGFGLTVTEAMWKGRPVIASNVGGIQDQVRHGKDGVLLDDPRDLERFEESLRELLLDRERREQLGAAAREHVRENFLVVRHLEEWAKLIEQTA